MNILSFKKLECFGANFRHGVILLSGTAAHAHTTYHFSATRQRNAAGEHHHAPMIGHMDSKELPARWRMLREILRRNSVTMNIPSVEMECNRHSIIGLHVSR
jgi:hypothetical protein